MNIKEKAVDCRKSGMSIKEICNVVNRSERTVSRWLKEAGFTNLGRSDISDYDVMNMYDEGYTIVEIAKHFECSHETIAKRLAAFGISCSRKEGIKRHFERVHNDMWYEIKAVLDSGMSVYDTSRKFHMRYNNVYRLMILHNYLYDYPDNIDEILNQTVDAVECPADRSMGFDEFVRRAIAVHGDEYDYSHVVYKNTKTPVKIICPIHGEFEQTPEKHLLGHGCPDKFCKKLHTEASFLKKYGTEYYMQCSEAQVHIAETKRMNGTFNFSKPEEDLYVILCGLYGSDGVFRQYRSLRYPWACDFYIKSRDLYIELNASWTHGEHWYDATCVSDIERVSFWKRKGFDNAYYLSAICTWTDMDVRKRRTAAFHGLNYIVFWENDLSDVKRWIDAGCPDSRDYESEYFWEKNHVL